jgi:hypothetical protein
LTQVLLSLYTDCVVMLATYAVWDDIQLSVQSVLGVTAFVDTGARPCSASRVSSLNTRHRPDIIATMGVKLRRVRLLNVPATMKVCMSLWAFTVSVLQVGAFIPSYERKSTFQNTRRIQMQMLPVTDFASSDGFHFSSILTAVDVFDGSGIIDPVVISSVFWTSLKAKLVAVIVSQILAVIVFAIISSLSADFLSKKLLGDNVPQKLKMPPKTSYIAQPDFLKLALCITIDVIGSSSEVVPIFGSLTDVVWAPIAGYALRTLYGSNVLFALEFTEEILPLTDVLPLATVCWVVDTFFGDSDLAKLLQLGRYGRYDRVNGSDPSAVDVKAESETKRVRLGAEKSDRDDER